MQIVKKSAKILLSIAIATLFLWLAFKDIRIDKLLTYLQNISYTWLLPFIPSTLLAHYFRSERWRLVLEEENYTANRLTLFAGVMFGYTMNYVFPRAGEISRSVYVARKEDLSSTSLVGTVIVERIIDMISMLMIMAFVTIYIIADVDMLRQIFGEGTIDWLQQFTRWQVVVKYFLYAVIFAVLLYGLIKLLDKAADRVQFLGTIRDKFQHFNRMLIQGFLAIRNVEQWGLFLLYTVLIWIGYVCMTYFPFWMFDLQNTYDLGLVEALTVTVISSIGIILPSPGGVGTYHYFVKQALLILFAVPAVTGLAYAIVTHAMMLILVVVSTGIILLLDKWLSTGTVVNISDLTTDIK